jgi:hypothetical protein
LPVSNETSVGSAAKQGDCQHKQGQFLHRSAPIDKNYSSLKTC